MVHMVKDVNIMCTQSISRIDAGASIADLESDQETDSRPRQ